MFIFFFSDSVISKDCFLLVRVMHSLTRLSKTKKSDSNFSQTAAPGMLFASICTELFNVLNISEAAVLQITGSPPELQIVDPHHHQEGKPTDSTEIRASQFDLHISIPIVNFRTPRWYSRQSHCERVLVTAYQNRLLFLESTKLKVNSVHAGVVVTVRNEPEIRRTNTKSINITFALPRVRIIVIDSDRVFVRFTEQLNSSNY